MQAWQEAGLVTVKGLYKLGHAGLLELNWQLPGFRLSLDHFATPKLHEVYSGTLNTNDLREPTVYVTNGYTVIGKQLP